MKKLNKIFCWIVVVMFGCAAFTSCDKIMEVDSDYMLIPDNTLNKPGDTLYSVLGILSQMQKLADPYIVLGEARADLLTETQQADEWIKQVCNHQVTLENPYIDVKPFYAVINNCNYVIAAIGADSTGSDIMNDRAAAIVIRAWTYWQLAIHFGQVVYTEDPVVCVDDLTSLKDKPVYGRDELGYMLYQQVLAVADHPKPGYGKIGPYDAFYYFPDVNFLLGELCLWRGDYMGAASYYKKVIENTANTASYKLDSRLSGSAWLNSITGVTTTETIWKLFFDATNGNSNSMYELFSDPSSYQLQPGQNIIDQWMVQKQINGTLGDRRVVSYRNYMMSYNAPARPVVAKMMPLRYDNADVSVYRAALAHLRYAEAVNRMGKPTMALCVLNYGLNKQNITAYVNPSEVSTAAVFNFENAMYENCLGVRGRVFAEPLVLPQLATMQDTIEYVEDLILQECALETAFEGNRWGDCTRIALRKENPGKYLGDLVARKYESEGGNAQAAIVKNVLANEKNWYLPLPERK